MTMAQPDLLFVMVACQYPGGMLDRTPTIAPSGAGPGSHRTRGGSDGPADLALAALLAWLKDGAEPDHLFTMGDQIYVDATAGLFDPRNTDGAQERLAETRMESPALKDVSARLTQVTALMDDHEVHDNWEPSLNAEQEERLQARMKPARAAFIRSQTMLASPPLWRTVPVRGTPFFIGDTRTERHARSPLRLNTARIMGTDQEQALASHLRAAHDAGLPFKFIATSSMVLPRRLATRDACTDAYPGSIESDAWDGYPASLHALLGHIVDHEIDNVVFMSGDEHIGMVTRITLRKDTPGAKPLSAVSIHAGALYAPYPFANATEFDFAETDSFSFPCTGGTATCDVHTWFPGLGDSFCVVNVTTTAQGQPALGVAYHSADGKTVKTWEA